MYEESIYLLIECDQKRKPTIILTYGSIMCLNIFSIVHTNTEKCNSSIGPFELVFFLIIIKKFTVTLNATTKSICYYKVHLLGGLAKVPDGLLLHCTKTSLYTIAHSAHGLLTCPSIDIYYYWVLRRRSSYECLGFMVAVWLAQRLALTASLSTGIKNR